MVTEDEFFEDTYGSIGKMFKDAYIGGWTAAERWDLLSEGSRCITLFSLKHISEKEIYGVRLNVQVFPRKQMFGIIEVETPSGKYYCSDLEKTIVDAMMYPRMFGDDLNHQEVIKNYMLRDDKDLNKLKTYFKLVNCPELMIRMMKEAQ